MNVVLVSMIVNVTDSTEQLHKPIGPWNENIGKEIKELKQPQNDTKDESIKRIVQVEENKTNEQNKIEEIKPMIFWVY